MTIVRKRAPHKPGRSESHGVDLRVQESSLPILSRRMPLDVFAGVLLSAYGLQGWWPLLAHAGSHFISTGRLTGYRSSAGSS